MSAPTTLERRNLHKSNCTINSNTIILTPLITQPHTAVSTIQCMSPPPLAPSLTAVSTLQSILPPPLKITVPKFASEPAKARPIPIVQKSNYDHTQQPLCPIPQRPPTATQSKSHQKRTPSSMWRPTKPRVHHRDDTVGEYCAPGSRGWEYAYAIRLEEYQKKIGQIDYTWAPGGMGVMRQFWDERNNKNRRRSGCDEVEERGKGKEDAELDEGIHVGEKETCEDEIKRADTIHEASWQTYTERDERVTRNWENVVGGSRARSRSAGYATARAWFGSPNDKT